MYTCIIYAYVCNRKGDSIEPPKLHLVMGLFLTKTVGELHFCSWLFICLSRLSGVHISASKQVGIQLPVLGLNYSLSTKGLVWLASDLHSFSSSVCFSSLFCGHVVLVKL